MTRTSGTIITMAFAAAAFTMLSQGASASTANMSDSELAKYCARMENRDTTSCREAFVRIKKKRQIFFGLMLDSGDGGGGGNGNGGRGGRGGRK